MKRLAVVLVLAAFVAACGDSGSTDTAAPPIDGGDVGDTVFLFTDDFEQVCRGIPQPEALAIADTEPPYKVEVFAGADPDYQWRSVGLPDDWYDIANDAAHSLVLCLDRTAEQSVQVCGPYEDDGTEWEVEIFDATYQATLYEAVSGDELASQTFEFAADGCPTFSSYTEGDPSPIPYYDLDSDILQAFLRPHVLGS